MKALKRPYTIEQGSMSDDMQRFLRSEGVRPIVTFWCKTCSKRSWRLAQVFESERTKTLIWMTYSIEKRAGTKRVVGKPTFLVEPADASLKGWIYCPHHGKVTLTWPQVKEAVERAQSTDLEKSLPIAV